MSSVEIGYDEHEGKRRRHWWNKIFGLFLIAPICCFFVFFASMVFLFPFILNSESGPNDACLVGGVVLALASYPFIFMGWLRLMKDDG